MLEFLLPHIVERETLSNVPSIEDQRHEPEIDPRVEEPESELDSQNESYSETIVQCTSPATQTTYGKRKHFAKPLNVKRRGFTNEKPSQESPSSQLMAFILAEKEAEKTKSMETIINNTLSIFFLLAWLQLSSLWTPYC